MSCAYEISPSRRLVYCRTWGAFTELELLITRQALQRDPAFDPSFSIVVELLDMDFGSLTADAVRELASSYTFSPMARRAFVVAEPGHYGIARMFHIQREMSGVIEDVRVCRSLQDALDWVDADTFKPTMLTEVV